MNSIKEHYKTDLMSGLVVFLVALPLCLGIALASGAPLFAGIISGIIGGIIVGYFSNSNTSVSGPAAGLTAIVMAAITSLGSYEVFLLAVIIAGLIQYGLGMAKAGTLSNYIPSNVIEGMLAAIGIIIMLKQFPHAVGYDADNEGDFFFIEKGTGHNSFSAIIDAVNFSHPGALIITAFSILVLIAFIKIPLLKKIKSLPSALVVVTFGVIVNELFKAFMPNLQIGNEHLVSLPVSDSFASFLGQFSVPAFGAIINPSVWITAITLAIVASIESLLCVEAADKLDPWKRITNVNTELKAQGIGNILSGLIGGIPMTSVIVRTSANIGAGARTKISAISHGVYLALAVLLIPTILNKIPLASLSAILLSIGYKLSSPSIYRHMWHNGKSQFVPFAVTILAVVFTDLLRGVGIGLAVSILFILKENLKVAYFFKKEEHHRGETIFIDLAQEVSFLNKAAIKQTLFHLPPDSHVVINSSNSVYIDFDVLQLLREFREFTSKEKNINLELVGFKEEYKMGVATHVSSHM
jgi:MFS superfamily sulfate permease-like transporter